MHTHASDHNDSTPPFTVLMAQGFMQQALRGLDFLHQNWVLHRCVCDFVSLAAASPSPSLPLRRMYALLHMFIDPPTIILISTHMHTHTPSKNTGT